MIDKHRDQFWMYLLHRNLNLARNYTKPYILNYTETILISILHVPQWYVDRPISFDRLTSIKLTAFHQTVSITYVMSNIKGKCLQHMYVYFDISSGLINYISAWISYDSITSELYVQILQISYFNITLIYNFICLWKHYLVIMWFNDYVPYAVKF